MNPTTQPAATGHLAGDRETKLVIAFFALIKTARLVDRDNRTYLDKRDDFFARLEREIDAEGQCVLKVFQNRYFVNEKLVRLSDDQLESAETVVQEWKTLGIGGVRFAASLVRDDLDQLITTLSDQKASEDNREAIAERLKSLGIEAVSLLAAHEETVGEVDTTERRQRYRQLARSSFFRAMDTVQNVMAAVSDEKDMNVARTKRVVHSLIDLLLQDESSLIELTAIKNYDDYTYAHSTNVCIYSLTIGVRIGMDRSRLSELGFSALFHDVGKVRLPHDLIAKPGAYDENDWVQMQRHPLLGAKTILRNMEFNMHTARAARGAFEHHINRDFTGYPVLRHDKREPTLMSKIIAIADTFDALTSGRVYIKKAIPADEVIRKMRYQMSAKFDPLLLKIFTDIVGIYPAGTLVLLSTEELALVLTQNDTDKTRPYVKIVGNREGLYDEPRWLDLADPANADRAIVRMVEPEKHGLNLQQFVLQD